MCWEQREEEHATEVRIQLLHPSQKFSNNCDTEISVLEKEAPLVNMPKLKHLGTFYIICVNNGPTMVSEISQ